MTDLIIEQARAYFDALVKSRFIEMFGTVRDNNLSLPIMKMGDIVEIRNGRDYKTIQNDNGKYPVYGTGGIITHADDYLCPENTVIIGRKGTINNPILVKEKFWNVDTAFGIICDQNVLNPIYYFWFCKQYDFTQHNKATTIPSLVKADLQKISVIVPDKERQDEFASFVKQVDKSKVIFEKEVARYDDLIKSRFIEMFGPYFDDDKCSSLGSLCDTFVDGDWIESKDQDESGIRLIQTGNIGIGTYLNKVERARFINEDTFVRLNCTEVFPGDVLISRLPDPLARSCIVPEGLGKTITGVDCTIIRFGKKINPVFFNQYTLIDHYLSQITTFEAGSTRKRISRKNLGKIKIPVPPIDLQNKFTSFVEQVDKSKLMLFESLKNIAPNN